MASSVGTNEQQEFHAPKEAMLLLTVGGGLGVVGLGAAAAMGVAKHDHLASFLFSYQVAFCYFLAIALGGLFFVTLQHLTKAGWSVVVRRLAEIIAGTLPVMFLLFLPVLLITLSGNHALFEWADPKIAAKDELISHKTPFLNLGFFATRAVICFAVWSTLAWFFKRNSVQQDATGDTRFTARSEKVSAPGMMIFALTLTLAAVDWIMSLSPHWYSTIIGVYYFAGCAVSIMATLILLSRFLQSRGKLNGVITTEHYHDLGKLLFAFTFFWGYIAFSQYMLIWYANIPEGTFWYLARQQGQWVAFAVALLFGHLLLPWVGLISRHAKRNPIILSFWAVWLLVFHWADMVYLIMPNIAHHDPSLATIIPVGLIDVACFVGVGGIFLAAVGFGLRGRALIPVKDPRLVESTAFENV